MRSKACAKCHAVRRKCVYDPIQSSCQRCRANRYSCIPREPISRIELTLAQKTSLALSWNSKNVGELVAEYQRGEFTLRGIMNTFMAVRFEGSDGVIRNLEELERKKEEARARGVPVPVFYRFHIYEFNTSQKQAIMSFLDAYRGKNTVMARHQFWRNCPARLPDPLENCTPIRQGRIFSACWEQWRTAGMGQLPGDTGMDVDAGEEGDGVTGGGKYVEDEGEWGSNGYPCARQAEYNEDESSKAGMQQYGYPQTNYGEGSTSQQQHSPFEQRSHILGMLVAPGEDPALYLGLEYDFLDGIEMERHDYDDEQGERDR